MKHRIIFSELGLLQALALALLQNFLIYKLLAPMLSYFMSSGTIGQEKYVLVYKNSCEVLSKLKSNGTVRQVCPFTIF